MLFVIIRIICCCNCTYSSSYLLDVIRFENYCFGQKALEKFADKIQGDNKNDRICVGLGDWSAQVAIKGSPHSPLFKFRKVLQRKHNITVSCLAYSCFACYMSIYFFLLI